ncbi:MAG: SMP-30/gluconolactonase/LRE family protein [Pseudomonadota bacterium]
MRTCRRPIALAVLIAGAAACGGETPTPPNAEETTQESGAPAESAEPSPAADAGAPSLPQGMAVFPADRSLHRPEDGVLLADGTLVVSDQRTGLAAIAPDGAVRPFGDFAGAGYVYAPPARPAGPNSVTVEPGGAHILVADLFSGAIYRVDVASEATEKIYQHAYGVNAARRDGTGALWFTQSTENAGDNSEARLFQAADRPMGDGALFRLAPDASDAERVLSGLDFANGFVVDEARGALYLAETAGDRLLGFTLDVATGALSDRRVVASLPTPDNVELGPGGRLWVASPISSTVVAIDPDDGSATPIFAPPNPNRDRIVAEWTRRGDAGETRLDLIGPDLLGAAPGVVTGVIPPASDGGAYYVTTLGDALVAVAASSSTN